MNFNSMEAIYYANIDREDDREHYLRDPDGNLAASIDEASYAYLKKGDEDWNSFRDYIEFSWKRSFVLKENVESWLTNLKLQPPWRDIVSDGRAKILTELFHEIFESEVK